MFPSLSLIVPYVVLVGNGCSFIKAPNTLWRLGTSTGVPVPRSRSSVLSLANIPKLIFCRKPFPSASTKVLSGDSLTGKGRREEDQDDASSIAPSASASDANSTLAGKRRTLSERKKILEEDSLVGEMRETEVFCTKCEKWIKLSSRTKYELKKWNAHITREHGRSVEDHAGDIPSDRVREAERKLQLVNDSQVKDFTAKRVTCLRCQENIPLHSSIPYQLDNWQSHKQKCHDLE